MVRTWRESYFKTPGSRVLFVMPQSWADAFIPMNLRPQPKQRIPALSVRGGFVRSISTEKMGFLSIDIGCGRRRREDEIDPAAGFLVEKNVGDRVEPGEPLAWLCLGEREPPRPNMERELAALFHVGDTKHEPPPLAIERL